jgi:hypothetical protein
MKIKIASFFEAIFIELNLFYEINLSKSLTDIAIVYILLHKIN